ARDVRQNIRAGRTVRGASTISMQVMRLSKGRRRTVVAKILEMFEATRLEARYSKDEILALYAAHAPFGGNVVGLEAASWRYFGRDASEMSWAEAAALAVLPNAPALVHPGRNREVMLEKRNGLLRRLCERGYLSETDLELALEEELPGEPRELPGYARHLVDCYYLTRPGERVVTGIDLPLQRRVEQVLDRWNDDLSREQIADLSAVVMDVVSGEVVAYVGNANSDSGRSGSKVDVARSPRSTGSILKPFLYESCLADGTILPGTLLPDIPININGFAPQNFSRQFSGAVPASEALARSLNVPAVHMLRNYGVPRFKERLEALGMTTLSREASDYGLSLILGGAEGKLLEIVGMYRDLAVRSSEICASYTLDALSNVNRPDEIDWKLVPSVRKVAWKTGTSWGFRDAWAVGVTPRYAVGVWAGNASGQGAFGLVGARTAGPVMFELFGLLPDDGVWFGEPDPSGCVRAEVCRGSGRLAGPDCPVRDTLLLPAASLNSAACSYHRVVRGESRFVLPAAMESYYRHNHPEYRPLTKEERVASGSGLAPMEFLYPLQGSNITVPKDNDGLPGEVTFILAHTDAGETVYWHLDKDYLGETKTIHEMSCILSPGTHRITCVDSSANIASVLFSVE
ncbi:MAG: transglycosylase domain-containing protein, partial [Bacteroidales bacterium]|nr:transglycosylase domain-containing protein [Bacteroidales bacterium]